MNRESLTLGASQVLILVGLAILLYGEYAGLTETAVPVGGVTVLAGVGILTTHVARLPQPEGADEGGH